MMAGNRDAKGTIIRRDGQMGVGDNNRNSLTVVRWPLTDLYIVGCCFLSDAAFFEDDDRCGGFAARQATLFKTNIMQQA
jgi:hypothetical protein